jgi:hypothetical protein
MRRETSVYVIVLPRRSSPPVTSSARPPPSIAMVVARCDEACPTDLPELIESEWNILVDSGESWGLDDIDGRVRFGRLMTAAARNERLLKKLFVLGQAHRIAIVDFIERYWAAKACHEDAPPLPIRGAARDHERARAGNKGR